MELYYDITTKYRINLLNSFELQSAYDGYMGASLYNTTTFSNFIGFTLTS